jgi:hypothetical protein
MRRHRDRRDGDARLDRRPGRLSGRSRGDGDGRFDRAAIHLVAIPYKNTPPYTDEGRKRLQARVDSLAQVFVEKVARNRGVSTDTVLKDFGQGDVMVGQAAIDAGLADRLDSFEASVYLLASTHNPDLVKAGSANASLTAADNSTIKDPAPVESQSVNETGEENAQTRKDTGELMSEKTIDPNQAAAATATAVTKSADPAAIQAPPATAPPAATEQAATPSPAASAPAPATVAVASENVIDWKAKYEETAQRVSALEKAATDSWIAEQVKGFSGDVAAHTAVLGALVAAHGKDGPVTKQFIELQKASAAQLETAGLFNETGASGASDADPVAAAEAKVEKLARERVSTSGGKLTYEKAYDQILQENRDLAAQIAG